MLELYLLPKEIPRNPLDTLISWFLRLVSECLLRSFLLKVGNRFLYNRIYGLLPSVLLPVLPEGKVVLHQKL